MLRVYNTSPIMLYLPLSQYWIFNHKNENIDMETDTT